MGLLQVDGLQCGYGKKIVLTDVSFELKQGEILGIRGQNGSGKSTLLQTIAGLKKQQKGQILRNNEKLSKRSRQLGIGYVPQKDFLIPECSVIDHLFLWYNDRNQLKEEMTKGLLEKLGIPEYYHKKCNELSGGMKQKVALACALANKPQILLLDEPTQAMDIDTKSMLKEYFQDYCKKGNAIMLVTHDIQEYELCHRILEIKEGKLYE